MKTLDNEINNKNKLIKYGAVKLATGFQLSYPLLQASSFTSL